MRKKVKRNGFTTVELVIVIAIIAILATVLIPTFSNLITKANDSKVLQEARNAYTGYLLENNGSAPTVMLYNEGERWIALKNGVPGEVCDSKEAALASIDASLDISKLTDTGDGKLFAYGGEVGNGENNGNNGGNNGGNDTPDMPFELTDWSGATAVFVGDSITAGAYADSGAIYYQCLKAKLNLASVTAKATSGSCISAKSDYGTNNDPLIGRWGQIPDAELIVIFMGTNDFGHATPLGTISDTTDVSFYGALNVIIPGIRAAHPNSQIVMITPLHRNALSSGMTSAEDSEPNKKGHTLEDYVNAIKEICQKYELPVIDLYNICTWDPADATYFNADKLHPNPNGHRALADLIAEAMATIPRKENNTEAPETPEYTPDYSLRIGNRFGGASFETTPNRICTKKNIYLKAGTIITIKDNATYNWAVSQETSEDSTNQGKYVFSAGWDTSAYRVIESDGWYGFTLARESNFDLDGGDSSDLSDYFVIVEQVEMQNDNRFAPNSTTASTRLSSTINLSLPAGTVITFKSDTPATHWAISKTTTAVSSEQNYKTSYSGNAWTPQTTFTITEDGWYGFVLKNDNTALSPTDCNLFDFFVISGYND